MIWQPIETAPRDGTDILGFDGLAGVMQVTHFWQGVWHDPNSHYYSECPPFCPAHWMPLPPGPSA
jgi:hypothetical protein